MNNLFLAKSKPRETIIEHTNNLLREYKRIKEIYPNLHNINWEILEIACIYHDIGKMNTKFQNKIIKNINDRENENIDYLKDELIDIEEIPHGYLSNAFIPFNYLRERFNEDEIKILYETIYYHHNREKLDGKRKQDLLDIINKDLIKYLDEFKYEKLIGDIKLSTMFNKYLRSRVLEKNKLVENDGGINCNKREVAKKFIMTKGLLNKIDFAASSGVAVEIKPGDLLGLTEKSIEKYGLNKLQIFMKENQEKSVVVKASTGVGKTEGALIWIGNNKGFFTLPLRVSINSIYDRIISKNKIAYPKDKIALLHSDTASEYMKRNEKNIIDEEYLNLTKQLSIPLTICTLDQLIGFIFKYEGFELNLATLSYSKLVIDEIQMYSSDMVAYLIIALRDIIALGGKFAILTATFPPIFEYFMKYIGIEEGRDYIKPNDSFLKEINGRVMLRHRVKVYKKNIDANIIAENIIGKKILVIVNTVKTAQRLYDELRILNDKLKVNINIFHSKFTREDRSIKENSIFRDGQLENEFEGIWITTQVVEASLDIDFDVLYTELSDIAGLLQRMGRVYRNRDLDTTKNNINIFVGDDKRPSGISEKNSIIDIDIFEKSKEVILKYNNYELDEKEKMNMVEEVYSVENLKSSNYFKNIKKTINDFNDIEPYDLKKNEARLRDIASDTVMPENIYLSNIYVIEELIEKLDKENSFSERILLKDEIMKKTLSIQTTELEQIKKNGGYVKEVKINKYESIHVIRNKYSFELGLEGYKRDNGFNENQFV